MKKFLKITGITLGVIIVLLLVLPFLFQGKILDLVKREANKMLNAQVDFGKLNLSFIRNFPNASISINDLYVVGINEFEGDTLASIDRLSATVNIKSLFGEQIEIKRILLDKPSVLAKVLADGKVNWDIVKETDEEPDDADEPDDGSFGLKLEKFTIDNGKVVYDDHEAAMKASLDNINISLSGDLTDDITTLVIRGDIEKINFIMDNIPYLKDALLTAKIDVIADLSQYKFTFSDNELKLNEIVMNFEGWLAMLDEGIDMDIKLNTPKLEFKHLLSMIPAIYAKDFESIQTKGNLQLDAAVKGLYTDSLMPSFDVKMLVADAYFKYPDLPKSVDDININASITHPGGDLDLMKIDVSKFHFSMGGNPFDIFARVATPMTDLQFNAGANGTLNLNMVKDIYPLDEGMDLAGIIKADLEAAGRMSYIEKEQYERLNAEGDLTLSGFVYKSNDMMDVLINNANLNFTPRYVNLSNLDVKMGNNDLQANGRLENFIAYVLKDETIKGELNISSTLLNVNDFIGTDEAAQDETESEEPLTVIEVPKNINFRMNANLKKVTYDDIILENIKGIIRVADGKLLIDNAGMDAFGGNMNVTGDYSAPNAQSADVDMKLVISNVLYGEIYKQTDMIKQLAPIFENMTGRFSTTINLVTKLDQNMSPVYNTIDASGLLTSKDLSVSNVKALDALAATLKNDKLRKLEAKDLRVNFKIKDGRVNTEPFDIKMGSTTMNLSGSTGLDQTIAYTAKVEFPQEIKNIPIKMDVKIGGTFTDPKISLGASETINALTETVTTEVKDAINENLQKLLDEARKQRDALVAAAEKQGNNIRSEAQKAGDKLVQEAGNQGQKLIDEANKTSNTLAKAAAVKAAEAAAKKLKDEAQSKSNDLVKAADDQATKLVNAAKEQGDKLIKEAEAKAKV